MAQNKIWGVLIDTKTQTVRPAAVHQENELEDLYKLLDCDCIDITVRNVNGKSYDIVCDDNGLLKDSPVVSAVSLGGQPALVGNLFVCHHTPDGKLKSLTHDEVFQILARCTNASSILRSLRVLVID